MSGIQKMYIIETGRIKVLDTDPLAANNTEKFQYSFPVPAILLVHNEYGPVLLDAGIEPNHFTKSAVHRLVYDENKRIDKQLASIGYTVDDVKHIVLSHWHRDHQNQLFLFPYAKVYLREKELYGLSNLPEKVQYEAEDYVRYRQECPNNNIILIPDVPEYDFFGDGSFITIDTKGHTMGHQSFLINLKHTGQWLFSVDAIHNSLQLEDEKNIQFTTDLDLHRKSVNKLLEMEKQGARLIYGHDAEQWKTLKLLPDYYD